MRKLIIALVMVFLLIVSSATVIGAPNKKTSNKNKFPTITVIFSDGKVADITGKMWATTIIPYVEGRIKDYKWEQNPDIAQYIFFDKALKGLNPYGLDFIKALEESTYEQFQHNIFIPLSNALNKTANLDSDHDGYTNIEELNNGTLPGFADSHPGMNKKTFWGQYGGYIIIGVLILSIFVLYFVFNKESEKEKL
ncbi:hypothetical protein [Candidatus Aciduliprofundum boonei]|uniref:Uncharacterized protein n=1 Tax=Aciduliprofundum boonei (strain DSM 19572 / T469) TaxID=439481 RepID=D3T958_ACIB4|nr:hypothetical protein [Candidatus Aciduliprofundum boonei]ADD08637.1 conserved hypothetical protein [Aciduliprofundum boonei T469]